MRIWESRDEPTNPQSEIRNSYSVALNSNRLGVPDGFPVMAPAVAVVTIQLETVADG